ncbi:MAG: hypothetical protein HY898_16785 [Deltaproteobacteria bacterium]|nr:hypothetical protein [Deltaproteobacteria bacterium]
MRRYMGWAAAITTWTCALPTLAANNAAFVSQNVPATVQAGAQFAADITLQNTGDTTWTQASGYYLGSQNPQDNMTWGTNRFAMNPADSIAPGASYAFHATLTAPSQPGDYAFQWQVLQDGVEWFGQMTPNLTIQVTAQPALTCDGTEKLCLTLKDLAAIQATGATVAGDVNSEGFLPADQGGLDWHFLPADKVCSGKLEVDVKGLLPQTAPGQPEQVSVFETCGEESEGNQVIGLQRMMMGYHGDNIFRYYATTDFNQYGWQLGIWTDGFEATGWTAEQTHHFVASWTSGGSGNASLALTIDGQSWNVGGTLPFNPQKQIFTLGNRCTHYPTQQAVARLSNFRLWAYGGCTSVVVQDAGGDTGTDASVPLDANPSEGGMAGSGGGGWAGAAGATGAGGTGIDGGVGGKGGAGASAHGIDPSSGSTESGCGCRTRSQNGPLVHAGWLLMAAGWLCRRRARGRAHGAGRPMQRM